MYEIAVELSGENRTTESKYIVGKVDFNKEYIPLFCIPELYINEQRVRFRDNYIGKIRSDSERAYVTRIKDSPLFRYLHPILDWLGGNSPRGTAKHLIEMHVKDFKKYIDSPITSYMLTNHRMNNTYNRGYSHVMDTLDEVGWRWQKAGDKELVINKGFVGVRANYDAPIHPLFCMMIRKDCITYYKTCLLLDEAPLGEIFKMYVNPEFTRTKGSICEGFRRHYNRTIKPVILEKNLEVVECNIWKEVLQQVVRPTFKTIRQEKEWLKDCSSKWLSKLKDESQELGEPKLGRLVIAESGYELTRVWSNPIINNAVTAYIANQDSAVRPNGEGSEDWATRHQIHWTPAPRDYTIYTGGEAYRLMNQVLNDSIEPNDTTESD